VDDTSRIVAALQARFPNMQGPKKSDICYATQNRQDAVRDLAAAADLVLVVGSANSSNSNRLRELAEKQGKPAYLIDGADDIRREWIGDGARVGLTAGASAPELLVEQVIAAAARNGAPRGAGAVRHPRERGLRAAEGIAGKARSGATPAKHSGQLRARMSTDQCRNSRCGIPTNR
jgi:hypothetical protein